MKRLFITGIALCLIHAPAVFGQTWHKPRKYLTIGFTTGASVSRNKLLKPIPCSNCYTNGLYLRRYINRNLAIESGIQFSTDHFSTPVVRVSSEYYHLRTQPLTTNIPLALKYYFSPAKKLRPFVGAGCYYSFGKTINTTNTDNIHQTTGAAFVPFYIMQGMSYKLGTRIEINETIHFTPVDENHCKQIGFNIGFGYQL